MENLVLDTYKNVKVGNSFDEESNLPMLNLAARNKSYHNKKMRFNKISM